MKRALPFLLILVLGAGALYYTQRRASSPAVSAAPIVDIVADAQHDLSRIPMRLTRLSDAEEIRIGDALAADYLQEQPPAPQDHALQIYVQSVGGKLALKAQRPLPYKFHVLPEDTLQNAFALPGGHVFIGRGMLHIMKTEDELAAVLGHEIEHVELRHCAERVQIQAQLQKLPLGGLDELAQIPVTVWQLGYSKDQEFEADREGTTLAVAGGYSPYGAVELFEQLQRLQQESAIHASTPEEEMARVAIDGLTGYFRSHPLTSERLEAVNRLIAERGWQDRKRQKPFQVENESAKAAKP